jgi:hypothetical protein
MRYRLMSGDLTKYVVVTGPGSCHTGGSPQTWTDVTVYQAHMWNVPSNSPLFLKKGTDADDHDCTDDIDAAQPYLTGYIKWDGCSNWDYEQIDTHFCGRGDALELGKLMDQLYTIANTEMAPVGDEELFEGYSADLTLVKAA